MGLREDEVRGEMARAADLARGFGQPLGVADMRYFAEELAYAAMEDARRRERVLPDGTVVVTDGDRIWVEELGDEWLQDIDFVTGAIDQEEAQNRHAQRAIEFVRRAREREEGEERAWEAGLGIDYDDRDFIDRERDT